MNKPKNARELAEYLQTVNDSKLLELILRQAAGTDDFLDQISISRDAAVHTGIFFELTHDDQIPQEVRQQLRSRMEKAVSASLIGLNAITDRREQFSIARQLSFLAVRFTIQKSIAPLTKILEKFYLNPVDSYFVFVDLSSDLFHLLHRYPDDANLQHQAILEQRLLCVGQNFSIELLNLLMFWPEKKDIYIQNLKSRCIFVTPAYLLNIDNELAKLHPRKFQLIRQFFKMQSIDENLVTPDLELREGELEAMQIWMIKKMKGKLKQIVFTASASEPNTTIKSFWHNSSFYFTI